VTPSRQRENKKSFAIKRDETNTEPLSGVNGASCRNCTLGFIVFRLQPRETTKERKERTKERKRERGRRGGKVENSPVTVVPHYVRGMDNEVRRGSCPTSLLFIFLKDKLPRRNFVAPFFTHRLVTSVPVSYISTPRNSTNVVTLGLETRPGLLDECHARLLLRLIISDLSHDRHRISFNHALRATVIESFRRLFSYLTSIDINTYFRNECDVDIEQSNLSNYGRRIMRKRFICRLHQTLVLQRGSMRNVIIG